jgi:hypothetical protein
MIAKDFGGSAKKVEKKKLSKYVEYEVIEVTAEKTVST